MSYCVLAYYCFTPIAEPESEVKKHKKFFENTSLVGRIYISEEGINGQVSGLTCDVEHYIEWLSSDSRFDSIAFKCHTHHENVFARMTVKYRKQLVALDYPVDIRQTGKRLSPAEWKQKLEHPEQDQILIDVRNEYEWAIGHFEGSTLPPLQNFRDFPAYAEALKKTVDPEKAKVLMCCTGGIRCELYSALLKEKGFTDVSQLDGGIINYGLKEGSSHWKGKLFVFDDRMAVNIDEKEAPPIAHCKHCNLLSDTYYNCANMDCNALFLACPSCHEVYLGCCSAECQVAPRTRPFEREGGNKPFRRKHLISSRVKDVQSEVPVIASSPEEPSSQV